MYLVAIAWLYVSLLMAIAEATSPVGSLLGAIITFVIYGIAPMALVLYLLGHSGRRRARQARERAQASGQPDRSGEPAADAVPPVRKEP